MKRDRVYRDDVDDDDELIHPSLLRHLKRQRSTPDPERSPRQARPRHHDEIADPTPADEDFTTTYTPARYEKEWLRESLRTFFEQELIDDVLAQVRGGKEANVYCCQAHPATGLTWLAAKVYRPQRFRNLSNDKLYREGRAVLTAKGRPVKATDHRIMRALGKKTTFGEQVKHTSWLMHEYTTLEHLHRAGAVVPRPLAASENAILMSYYGAERMAAPTLNTVTLPPDEVTPLYQEVLRNIELMLRHGLIHGDLSAYNILYWEGRITIIDFPQVTHSQSNPHAHTILQRDITRICQYFAPQGVMCDPLAITAELWDQYVGFNPDDAAADASALS